MSAVEELGHLQEKAKSGGTAFETDPDAPEGTYEWHLHRARLDVDAYRGKGPEAKRKVEFKSAAKIISEPAKRLQWQVKGILSTLCVIVISADPKSSKTWALIEMLVSIANAVPAFGEFLVGAACDVALFAPEDSERSMRNRIIATACGKGLDPVKAASRIHVQCRGLVDVLDDADLCAIIAGVRMLPHQPEVLGIDPFRDVHTAEENSSTEMHPVMARLRLLRDILGISVIFVHHNVKGGSDKASRRPMALMRGSTAIWGAVDGAFCMGLKEHTEMSWTSVVETDVKEGRAAGTFELRLDVQDDDNNEATCARWTFSREVGAKKDPSGPTIEETVMRVIELLGRNIEQDPSNPYGMTKNEVRIGLGVAKKVSDSAVDAAEARGLIRKISPKRGYVLVRKDLQ